MIDEKNPVVTITKTKVTTLVTTIGIIALAAGLAGGVIYGGTRTHNKYTERLAQGEKITVKVPSFVVEKVTEEALVTKIKQKAEERVFEDYNRGLGHTEATIPYNSYRVGPENLVPLLEIGGGSTEEITKAIENLEENEGRKFSPDTYLVTGEGNVYYLAIPTKIKATLEPTTEDGAKLLEASNMLEVVREEPLEGGTGGGGGTECKLKFTNDEVKCVPAATGAPCTPCD